MKAYLFESGGTVAANVCGNFVPNYTRRLSFGRLAQSPLQETLLVMQGLIPVGRALVRFG
jgi:hypothetical protein